MNILGYFTKKRTEKLPETTKQKIFSHIVDGTHFSVNIQTTFSIPQNQKKRFLYLYRTAFAYTTALIILFLSFYIPFLGNNNSTPQTAIRSVEASYIAKVITFEGGYYIENGNNRIEGENINEGDLVTLQNDARLTILVGDKITSTVTGPASFTVKKAENGYEIVLHSGDFIEVASTENAALNNQDVVDAPQITLSSPRHNFRASNQQGERIHLLLTKEDSKPLLINKSSTTIEIIATTEPENGSSEETTVLLAQNNTVELGTFIFDSIASPSDVATVVAQIRGETPQRQNDTFSPFNGTDAGDSLAISSRSDINTLSAMSTFQAGEAELENQREDTHNSIRILLTPQFVWLDVKNTVYHYTKGNENGFLISHENLLKRIYSLYDAFGISIPAESQGKSQNDTFDIERTVVLLTHLTKNIPEDTPLSQKETLGTMTSIVNKLSKKPFGILKDNISVSSMKDILSFIEIE